MEISSPVGLILERKERRLWTIAPGATVFDAISLMAEKNIGALPVMEGERLVGMISERDYTRKVILQGRVSRETAVADIMSRDVVTVTPEVSIEDCMEILTKSRVRHLPVRDGEKVLGIVSIGDLVNWIIVAQSTKIGDLERFVTGAYPG